MWSSIDLVWVNLGNLFNRKQVCGLEYSTDSFRDGRGMSKPRDSMKGIASCPWMVKTLYYAFSL